MKVEKSVIESCEKLVLDQISANQVALRNNKREINRLAREQRKLKSQIGVLYGMRNSLSPKKV